MCMYRHQNKKVSLTFQEVHVATLENSFLEHICLAILFPLHLPALLVWHTSVCSYIPQWNSKLLYQYMYISTCVYSSAAFSMACPPVCVVSMDSVYR